MRQVLKNSLNHNREDRNYKVIVLSSENERKIDSRQIKYHLTEQTGKNLNSVFVSNPEFIVPLISDDCKILVVMGAEAFDDSGNVIRTCNYKKCLNELKKRTENAPENLKVIVCAESFKNIISYPQHFMHTMINMKKLNFMKTH
ncbi:MAG: hypothetical protein IPN13_06285 [Bacteroidetes bacterium]|nr:hypothetical protein [Bacteroidota bacterium]